MPIIRSLLDLDFYKPTMGQFAWRRYRDMRVMYGFTNRTTKIKLAKYVFEDELREEIEHIRSLHFTAQDLWYLRTAYHINQTKPGIFSKDFLYWLENLTLPAVEIRKEKGGYRIEVSGKWPEAIWWETMILSVVNELYGRSALVYKGMSQTAARREGDQRLLAKVALLKQYPEIKVVEFGTRRRLSQKWQRHVLDVLLTEIPNQVLGTSNVALAKEFGIKPTGTVAHETGMVLYGVDYDTPNPALAAHRNLVEGWWDEYGESLSIALTDTFGTDFFLDNFGVEEARRWRGVRPDSGDPFEVGEKIIAFYKKCGIDPRGKLLLFSDGLTAETIVALYRHFHGRIQIAFGWGTNLTNDVGIDPLSIVMKITQSCGHPVVKLSDNPAKVTGNPKEVERAKQLVGYQDRPTQTVVY